MFRPTPLLVGAALALAALGGYDVLRGDTRAAIVGPAPPAAAAPIALTATRVPLGEVVTSAGATLYRYDKDTAKPARSTCTGQCAATWPPVLTTSGTPLLTGIDPALIGIVLRPDGTEQLTLAGWPLYRFSGDTAPGQTLGEGKAGAWHAVGPSGKPAVAAKASKRGAAGSVTGAATPAPAPKPAPKRIPAPDPEPSYDSYGY